MNSSGIKRGLASLAVSALAVSGLASIAGTAHAETIDQIAGGANAVALITQDGSRASINNDGQNTTVTLLAAGGANIAQVRFAYSVGGAADQTIATVARANGAFGTQWSVPTNVLGGNVTVKAIGLNAAGAVVADESSTISVLGGGASVAIDAVDGAEVGGYVIPGSTDVAVAVTGTTAGTSVAGLDAVEVAATPAQGPRAFSGIQVLSDYGWSTDVKVADEAVLYAATADDDDAVPVRLYKQSVAGISATAASSAVPVGTTTTVTVKVVDQKGNPIAGASVQNAAGDEQFTNGKGEVKFTGVAPQATAHQFHVNTTAALGFDSSTDYRTQVTVGSYVPAATAITVTPKAAVLDLEDNITGNFTVKVKDQNDADLAGASDLKAQWIHHTYAVAPGFDGTGGVESKTTAGGVQSLNNDYTVPAPTGGFVAGTWELKVWQEKNGTPGQQDADLRADVSSVKLGQAKVVWNSGNNTLQAANGTDALVGGKVVLNEDDSIVLPGRDITVTRTSTDATGDNAEATFAPKAAQPEGVTVVSPVEVKVKTGADGTFAVKVIDPQATAEGVSPKVTAGDENIAVSVTPDFTATNAQKPNLNIQFRDLVVDNVQIDDSAMQTGGYTPGRPVKVEFTVTNKAGKPLANVPVELSVDKGFFPVYAPFGGSAAEGWVPPAFSPQNEPAVKQGDDWGSDYINMGSTRSLTTNAQGKITGAVVIEGDEDFNDDFQATVKVSAKVAGETKSKDLSFTSEGALNVKSVEITPVVVEGRANQSGILPKASTTRQVFFDLKAVDQFGNRTSGDFNVRATGANGAQNLGPQSANPEGAFSWRSSGDAAGDQTFVAKGNVTTTTWNDTRAAGAAAPVWKRKVDTKEITSEATTINWYAIDFAKGDYSLTHNGDELNPVGKVVRATFKALDQEGEPITGMPIEFFRSGPGDQIIIPIPGIGGASTGVDGSASMTFQGTGEGTAVVSVVGQDGDGNVVDEAELSTEIVFGSKVTPEPQPEPQPPAPQPQPQPKGITVKLQGKNNGKKADRLNAVASADAKGATIRLQRRNAKGKWVTVRTATLNASGRAAFTVKDRNGKKATAYRVRVLKTAATKAAVSPVKRVR